MARQWRGDVVAQQCGAVQFGGGGRVVRCAQQQPVAVNPGIDGADLADLEAHAATRVLRRVRALSQHTAKRLGLHRLAAPPARLLRQASLFSFPH